ncbi:uncharacterized protein LOC143239596 [Tachypleus tridentatus]|uniref:uncharacterized protein LOC143239596 n=1 Tax=Tachypleus tridentatus TaxID=6853 RepID=UPI003FD69655
MMGPLSFVSCSVCGREYGSQSIKFHEPKCLEKWKSVTMIGPSSPQKTRLYSSIPSITTTTRWRCEKCKVIIPLNVKDNHLAACIKNLKSYSTNSVERPRTRTLERPTVLVTNTTRTPRPKTETLPRPTVDIDLPVVDISNINREDATKTATVHRRTNKPGIRTNGRTGRSKKSKLPIGYYHIGSRKPQSQSKPGLGINRAKHHHYSVFTITGHHSYVPMPCRTCHRSIAPEKLHSHGSNSQYELGTIIKHEEQKVEERLKNSLSPKRNTDINKHKRFQKFDSKITSSKSEEVKTDKASETNGQTKVEPKIILSSGLPKNNRNTGENNLTLVSSCKQTIKYRNSGKSDLTLVSSCNYRKSNRNIGAGDSTLVSSCDQTRNNQNIGEGDLTLVSSRDQTGNKVNIGESDSTLVSSRGQTKNNQNIGEGDLTLVSSCDQTRNKVNIGESDSTLVSSRDQTRNKVNIGESDSTLVSSRGQTKNNQNIGEDDLTLVSSCDQTRNKVNIGESDLTLVSLCNQTKNNQNIGESDSILVSSCDQTRNNQNIGEGDLTLVSSCDQTRNNQNIGEGDLTLVSSRDQTRNKVNIGESDSTLVSSCDQTRNNQNIGEGDLTLVSSRDQTRNKVNIGESDSTLVSSRGQTKNKVNIGESDSTLVSLRGQTKNKVNIGESDSTLVSSRDQTRNKINIGECDLTLVSSCDHTKNNQNIGESDLHLVSSCDHTKSNQNIGESDKTLVSSCDHTENNQNIGESDKTLVSSCDHTKTNQNIGESDSTLVSSSDERVRKKTSIVSDRRTVTNMPELDATDITKSETSTGKAVRGLRTILCYICGREFGTKSLAIHEPQCLEKWKRENDALPSDQKRSVPRKPHNSEALTRDEYNEASWKIFQSQLAPCPECGRTFFPDRLPIHQRACKGKNDNGGSKSNSFSVSETSDKDESPSVKKLVPRRCPLMTCYICGRQFGTKSISLHEPQCLRKWKLENDKHPFEQQRTVPKKSEPQIKENGTIDVGGMEDAAWKSHLQQLVPCGRCGRTFFPDRLTVHERNCKYLPSRKTSSATPSHKSNLSPPPNSSSLTLPQQMVIEKQQGNSFFLYFP